MFEFLGSRQRRKAAEAGADPAADGAVARIRAAGDIDALIAALRDTARAVVVADGITVARRDGDEIFHVSEDAIGPLSSGKFFSIGDCVGGIAIRAGATLAVPDILADHSIPQNVYLATFVRSMVVAPISRTEPVLAIGAYWQAAEAIPPVAIERIEWLAALAADRIAELRGTPGPERQPA